ncbi:hypothetical protein TI10_19505 [Photorhabdus luminescens subsp. luminescens]|uniref:DUF4225 domain-containing protein n=1 Tax=Photorhabdus luminescens TaxID=29488 RepID=A0A1G5R671_PHOLU|nr:DUF4225 domain-containing protein [Photorhabdus luminescens]KMW71778.1 hypothetical protein TI10_19505 [Photorhabdus luminescens subsp. luminescens]SCZ69554.1 Protein of unknown function [Photorhabdus luminescens]
MKQNNLLDLKVRELRELAKTLSFRYLTHSKIRMDFNSKINLFVEDILGQVRIHCLSPNGAIEFIQFEINHLKEQDFYLTANRVKQYAIIEKEKEKSSYTNLILKQIGFGGGGTQILAGYTVCKASLGLACASFGAPLMAHGYNNVVENGYYLLYRENINGGVREGYRYVANKIGLSDKDADITYATVDLALSGYGIFRKVLKPREKSWSLFRNINSDFTRGWKEMDSLSLSMEMAVDGVTLWSIYKITEEEK